MRCFAILAVLLAMAIGGLAAFLWSGSYNVSARVPHWRVTKRFLETARSRSIAAHSKEAVVNPMIDPAMAEEGFSHYHAMCRLCHGAPGYRPNEFAQGLNPKPPDLTRGDVQRTRTEAELYWIVENGFKMTGMPAFGPTHSDEEIKSIIAFLESLPDLQPEEYMERVWAAGMRENVEEPHHHRGEVEDESQGQSSHEHPGEHD